MNYKTSIMQWLNIALMMGSCAVVAEQDMHDVPLESFKLLLDRLTVAQEGNPSEALVLCKQKLAKNKKIPKEVCLLMPDIIHYLDSHSLAAQAQITAISSLCDELVVMKEALQRIMRTLDTNALDSDRQGIPPEQLVGIRQLIIELDSTKGDLLAGLAQLVQNTNDFLGIYSTDNQNSPEPLITVLNKVSDGNTAIQGLIGLPGDLSLRINSAEDIDAQQATIIQWLKTICRLLHMMQGPCWESCVETCWK